MDATLQHLRQQLREKFPDAHQSRPPETHSLGQSLPAFPKGALTELSPATPSASLPLLLAQLLNQGSVGSLPSVAGGEGWVSPALDPSLPPQRDANSPPITNNHSPITPTLALIDGRDSFDPASYGPAACARLLWIRCHHADESLRCTDLLLRDGNLPLLVLDLQLNPAAELNAIPSSSWYRLRNLARQSGTTLLAFTPRPLIPAAALQLTLTNSHLLLHLESPHDLTEQLQITSPRPSGTTHVSRGF